MKQILPNLSDRGDSRLPTLVIAMPDLLFAEMISECNFSCLFRTLVVLEDGLNCVKRIQDLKPDFLLIDSEMPLMNGFDLAEKFKSLNLTTKIIMYASKRVPEYLHKYLDSSNRVIQGFIHKGCGIGELERCFIEVFAGKKYLSNCISDYMNCSEQQSSHRVVKLDKLALLTERERDVWNTMSTGKTERQIGECLCIGIATVKTYKKRIKEKLGIVGKQKLTYLALNNYAY